MSIENEEYELENPYGLETDSDFHATRRNVTISLIKEHTNGKEDIKILDVGCGKGIITKSINQHIPSANIDAIDISEIAIELAKKDFSDIHFNQADAMTFTGFGYNYDIIVLNNIYEHVENPTGLLLNLKQFLTDEGAFIISTPNRYYIRNVLRKFFGLRIVIGNYHITEYSIGQIFDHHYYAGLKIENVILPEFKRERFSLTDLIIFKLFQPILDTYLKLLRSRTRLGSLIFIISKKII